MGRSGYSDDYGCDDNSLYLYRGAVASAFRGKRGQAFLLEALAALDAMPEKKLAAESLKFEDGAVCTLGAVAVRRGLDADKIEKLDAQFEDENQDYVAKEFGIATCMVREIVYMNDEATYRAETPEQRFERMRAWIVSEVRPVPVDEVT
jgi:hypothetical protein